MGRERCWECDVEMEAMTQSFLITRHDEQYILDWFADHLRQQWSMGIRFVTANTCHTLAWRTVYRYQYRPDRSGG